MNYIVLWIVVCYVQELFLMKTTCQNNANMRHLTCCSELDCFISITVRHRGETWCSHSSPY